MNPLFAVPVLKGGNDPSQVVSPEKVQLLQTELAVCGAVVVLITENIHCCLQDGSDTKIVLKSNKVL